MPTQTPPEIPAIEWAQIKARQKSTWESGDFGEVARYNMPAAQEFIARLPLRTGWQILDVACGSGNLAILAAQAGGVVSGIDLAANLIAQARQRAVVEKLEIDFREGDVESLPYADKTFDAVLSMYGAMFAPRPEVTAAELFRVTRPGGFVAMANWTPEGLIGKMFKVFEKHFPPALPQMPSPMLWGDEATARQRLSTFAGVQLTRRTAVMRYPFPPAGTVEFFRRFYGPTGRAFASLAPAQQTALFEDLVAFQAAHNSSGLDDVTEVRAEYLEVIAVRGR
jgi:SAM-dependent methyltransferase